MLFMKRIFLCQSIHSATTSTCHSCYFMSYNSMEKKGVFKKYYSDLTDRVSKSFKNLLTFSEQKEGVELAKSDAYKIGQTTVNNFRRNQFVTAWNTQKILQDRRNRPQHLYENSRSQYTRARLRSLHCVEETEEVQRKNPKQYERRFSVPSIFKAASVNNSVKNTPKRWIPRPSASSSVSSHPEEALSEYAKEAASDIGSQTDDIMLQPVDDIPQGNDRTERTESDIVTQWLQQNCDDPQINADRLPTRKLLKYWMNMTDDTMQKFLKSVQRRSPSAYVLELLKHRLDENVSPNQAVTEENDNGSKNSFTTDKRHETYDRQCNAVSLGPWNKRVIVIGDSPNVSPHPKRKFCSRLQLNNKDKIILKRRTALNVAICSKGISIGNIKFILQFLTVSEQLKVNLRAIEFVDDYSLDEETIYLEIDVMTDKDNICKPITSKSRLVLNDNRRVQIEEDVFMKDMNIFTFHTGVLTFTLFSMKRNIKTTHRRVAEARFPLKDLKAITMDVHSTALIRC